MFLIIVTKRHLLLDTISDDENVNLNQNFVGYFNM